MSEETIEQALSGFGWTCGPEFWDRYYTDAWIFNLANAVEHLVALAEGEALRASATDFGSPGFNAVGWPCRRDRQCMASVHYDDCVMRPQ